MPSAGPPAVASRAFAVAAPSEPTRIMRRGETMSARLRTLEPSAPVTKPSWTAIVSHEAAVLDRSHSARSCGMTADAENHVVIVGGPLSPSVWYIRVSPFGSVTSANSLRSAWAPHVPETGTAGLGGAIGSTEHGWMFVHVAPLSVDRQTPTLYAA